MVINILGGAGALLSLPVAIAALVTAVRRMRGKPSSFRLPAAVLLVASSVALMATAFLGLGSVPNTSSVLAPANILLLLWVLVISPRQVARARRPSTN